MAVDTGILPPNRVSFRSWIWDSDTHLKSKAERRLLLKLDLSILIIGCLGFFMKFLDQTNLMNAYVSGMKEDLQMNGNEYTYANTMYTIAYAIMQVPSTLIVQKVRPALWLALMEVGWGVWTFAQAGITNSNQLYAFRFLVGLFESSFSPVILYLIGGWYTKTEMAKRTALFMMTAPIGTAFSGFMQAAVFTNLDGVNGLAGWRWLYIICGIMTVPVGISTFFFLPDSPFSDKVWFLTEEEHALALERVRKQGTAPATGISFKQVGRVLTRWRWYGFVAAYVVYGCSSMSAGFFAIWLKSEGYSVVQTNVIPTGTWLISGFATVLWGYLSDYTGSRFLFVVIPLALGLISNGILAFWPAGVGIKMFAFLFIGVQLMPGVFFAWAMEVCREDNIERAVVASSMNGMTYAVVAWLPIVIFPQTMAPDFRYGYPASFGLVIASIIAAVIVKLLIIREKKNKRGEVTEVASQGDEESNRGAKDAVTDVKGVVD
ncbi:related to transporter protein [Cephalotrichum gorgonifer]|uniref:Related to transporter protein n=1 Tax=Cephalotrichum gorgonifer TaxID=2041049 RepID=A0AAE8N8N6_9PEZI|nr:related to transporter protein [Cephalotrichum gorgonifer]